MRAAFRVLKALVAPILVMAALLLLVPSPVGASILDPCSPTPPTPSAPGSGVAGTFDPGPPPPGSSLYDKYSVGPSWSLYDLGCSGELGHPEAVVDNMLGNAAYGAAKALVSMGQGVQRLIDPPSFLHSLDRLVTSATSAFRSTILVVWLPVSLLLLGVLIAARAWKQDMAHALRGAAWALLVLGLATYATDYPIRASEAADGVLTSTLGTVDSTLSPGQGSPTSATGTLEVDGVLYPFWLDGEVGSSTSQTARTDGPKLFADQSLDWGQPVTDAATNAKEQDFAQVASEVQSADPTAYHQLTGENGGRTGAGIMALIAALITVSFKLVAGALVIASLLILRLVVILLPALAVIGLHERTSMVVKGTLMAGGAALLNSVIFSAGAGVSVFATSLLLSPSSGLPQWVALLLSAVVAYLLWHLLRPFRRLTHMVSGAFSPVHAMADGVGQAHQSAGRWTRRLASAMTGGAAAVAAEVATETPPAETVTNATTTTTPSGRARSPAGPEAWSREGPPILDVPSWPAEPDGEHPGPVQSPPALSPASPESAQPDEPPPEPPTMPGLSGHSGVVRQEPVHSSPPLVTASPWPSHGTLGPAPASPPEEIPEPPGPELELEQAPLLPIEERAAG